MFSIGEFSRATGLTVKTLRFYHEEGLLEPRSVDPDSGYRYYGDDQIETARAIALLRGLEFSLADIKQILAAQVSGEPFIETLERQKAELEQRVKQFRAAARTLNSFIADERQAIAAAGAIDQIQQKHLQSTTIAGIRMKGRYDECGAAFARIAKALGRHISGKALLLHYDSEFKEDDADFEACLPIRVAKNVGGMSVRELPGGPAISLVHRGPYQELGRSYARVIKYARQKRYEILLPTREVYLKGPGMIFRGNPRTYLTEIQLPIRPGSSPQARPFDSNG